LFPSTALLAKREDLQAQIDAWHLARAGQSIDQAEYQAFLRQIGYLVPEPAPFQVGTQNVDPEIATLAGPKLVVPVLNARFLLNAANARWGSLYDAYYGTDALDAAPARPGGYDEERGAAVIAAARRFLNSAIPGWEAALTGGSSEYLVASKPGGYLFRNNGLHIEVVVDPAHPVGKTDPLGIADVVLESALTTICDLEDSVAAVDGEDKLNAYRNWLGVIRGDLAETFDKGGRTMTRTLNPDRV
jgi:malate synthase